MSYIPLCIAKVQKFGFELILACGLIKAFLDSVI